MVAIVISFISHSGNGRAIHSTASINIISPSSDASAELNPEYSMGEAMFGRTSKTVEIIDGACMICEL